MEVKAWEDQQCARDSRTATTEALSLALSKNNVAFARFSNSAASSSINVIRFLKTWTVVTDSQKASVQFSRNFKHFQARNNYLRNDLCQTRF